MDKLKKHESYLYLFIGFIFLFFFNGRWILPIAAFVAPLFLMRFLRFHSAFKGFLFVVAAFWISNIFIWKGMLPMSGFLYYLVSLMMAIFTSLTFLLDRIYTHKLKGIVSTLVFPSAYVILDYVTISTNPSGSYGTLVHTQTSLSLLQVVSVTGIWGVVFLITWTVSVINWLWDNHFEQRKIQTAFWAYAIPFLFVIGWGQFRLSQPMTVPTVRIASINNQKANSLHQLTSGDETRALDANEVFLKNCAIAAASGAKIVFGSETIIRLTADQENDFLTQAKAIALYHQLYLGLPLNVFPKENANKHPENKITWISPTGEQLFTYHKAKPTYAGECDEGDGIIQYVDTPYGRLGSAICFDMNFPQLIRQAGNMNIDLMLVPGSDWEEISPYHTYVASVRAIENGFNMVRSANKGFSASFNDKGQLLSSSDFFRTDEVILYSDVPVKGQKTIYAVLGDYFAWLCILFFLTLSLLLPKKSWMKTQSPSVQ